jgi:hypothetical protein
MMETPSRHGNGNGVVKERGVLRAATGVLALLLLGGCAVARQAVVRPGDRATVDFTCRFRNGDIAATTSAEVTRDASRRKSAVFLPRDRKDSVVLVAGREAPTGTPEDRSFEGAILSRLSAAIVGLREGTGAIVELGADTAPNGEGDGKILPMARVRRRPRELRMSREEYVAIKKKEPEAGEEYTIDPLFPGKVVSAEGNEVVIRFSSPTGPEVPTPFGKAKIREREDGYELDIDVRNGSLVRTGPLVGRVVPPLRRGGAVLRRHGEVSREIIKESGGL